MKWNIYRYAITWFNILTTWPYRSTWYSWYSWENCCSSGRSSFLSSCLRWNSIALKIFTFIQISLGFCTFWWKSREFCCLDRGFGFMWVSCLLQFSQWLLSLLLILPRFSLLQRFWLYCGIVWFLEVVSVYHQINTPVSS